jgi:hypothetical protein
VSQTLLFKKQTDGDNRFDGSQPQNNFSNQWMLPRSNNLDSNQKPKQVADPSLV